MLFVELEEKMVKRKVIRDGKKIIKKTSDKEGYTIKDGKEKKIPAQQRLKMSKAQKRGAMKRKKSKNIANIKRKKSMERRTF